MFTWFYCYPLTKSLRRKMQQSPSRCSCFYVALSKPILCWFRGTCVRCVRGNIPPIRRESLALPGDLPNPRQGPRVGNRCLLLGYTVLLGSQIPGITKHDQRKAFFFYFGASLHRQFCAVSLQVVHRALLPANSDSLTVKWM